MAIKQNKNTRKPTGASLRNHEKIKFNYSSNDLPHNYIGHPSNVFEPRIIEIDNCEYQVYAFHFKGLYDLYNYLKSEPLINRTVWIEPYHMASLDKNINFYGKPYDQALEDLIAPPDEDYNHFLKIEKTFDAVKAVTHKYETSKSIAGGKLNIPAYTAGSPLCYESSKMKSVPKFVTINATLSYNCTTTKEQVLNRAIILTSLISSLEKKGYTVNVNAFQLDRKGQELFYVVFELKKFGEKINYPALYKSMCQIEFLRRISFRLLETSDVILDWKRGYGIPCEKEMALQVLKLNKNDLYFDQPKEMRIKGKQLNVDFINAIDYLNISNLIDVDEAKKEFKQKVKKL